MDPRIVEMQTALKSDQCRIKLTWAWNTAKNMELMWGCAIYLGRKQVGLTLFPSEDVEQTPANALRALANLIEVKDLEEPLEDVPAKETG